MSVVPKNQLMVLLTLLYWFPVDCVLRFHPLLAFNLMHILLFPASKGGSLLETCFFFFFSNINV